MVRRRNRMEASEVAKWLVFEPALWPGRCVVEQLEAWREAGREAYLADSSLNALSIIRARYAARRRVQFEHRGCDVCGGDRVERSCGG